MIWLFPTAAFLSDYSDNNASRKRLKREATFFSSGSEQLSIAEVEGVAPSTLYSKGYRLCSAQLRLLHSVRFVCS